MLTHEEILTFGRYGYRERRIRRDDFARVIEPLIPISGADRVAPVTTVPTEAVTVAVRHCLELARLYPNESFGRSAQRVAQLALHPETRGGAGQMLLYAAALLCQEAAARAACETGWSVRARLEFASAAQASAGLLLAVSDVARYSTQSSFDGDFVRGWM